MSAEGFADHFSDLAGHYAAHRPTYPPALVQWLAEQAPGTTLAWDAGCGSGQLSVPLAEHFARVVATDASGEQIARAAPHPGVEYRRAPAGESGLAAGSVDLAVAAQAAHWFPLDDYYREVRRVARPGALVALVTYGGVRAGAGGLDALLEEFYAGPLGPHWPPERRQVEEGYRALPFPFAELPTPALEIRARWTVERLLGYVESWSAVRALRGAEEGRARVERFRAAVAEAWARGPAVRELRWPLAVRAGRL